MPIIQSYRFTIFIHLFLLIGCSSLLAQHPDWDNPNSLPQWLTPEEKTRLHEIGIRFEQSPPPEGPVRSIAEFEPQQGVLIRYPLGIPLELVTAMSEHVTVYTLVSNWWTQNQAINAYQNAGVQMDNCEFIIAPTNSYWTRDYGPWFVTYGDNEIGVVDFIYNRPRPADDAIPGVMSDHLNIERFGMNLVHTGGNYMSAQIGTAASCDLVYAENNNDQELVDQKMLDYQGINTYHVTIDAPDSYIQHIDTWAKFLAPDKILIAEVPTSHPRHWAYEQVADYFASQISPFGKPYEVIRVYTPNGEPYTNSLILNERIYVPITGSSWDEAALAVYEDNMPGYEVLGFEGSWLSTDALHCRVKDIADTGMLYIEHLPLFGELSYEPSYEIEAMIIPYSGANLYTDSLFVIYQANSLPFDTVPLVHSHGNQYNASIPVSPGDTLINYYLFAADASGRREHWPLIGAPGARSFRVEVPLNMEFTADFQIFNALGEHVSGAVISLGEHTNEAGDYTFTGLAPGDYAYTVSKSCYALYSASLSIVNEDLNVSLTLTNQPGDANGDGVVNVLDAIAILEFFLGEPPEAFCMINADINADNVVDALDVIGTISIFLHDDD